MTRSGRWVRVRLFADGGFFNFVARNDADGLQEVCGAWFSCLGWYRESDFCGVVLVRWDGMWRGCVLGGYRGFDGWTDIRMVLTVEFMQWLF